MKLSQIFKSVLGGIARPKTGSPPKFPEMAAAFGKRLATEWADLQLPKTGPQVGVLITPWMFTPAPFFAFECGLALASTGSQVKWLWDAGNVFLNAGRPREVYAIREIFDLLPKGMETVAVHGLETCESFEDSEFLALLIYENAVRELKGEDKVAEFLAANPGLPAAMREHVNRIESLLTQENFDWLLLPGGVWASSGIYARIASRLGIDYTSYDSGPGELFVGKNGPAAHFPDIPPSLSAILDIPLEERTELVAEAEKSLRIRMAGQDEYRLQPKPAGTCGDEKCDVLVPLNYRADTAALCRQKIFESVREWIVALCEWAEQNPRIHLVIRQHPCERIPEFRGSDRWDLHLGRFSSLGERLRFVNAEDDINTYDLLAKAKVVLPFTSRVGIEAAMMRKPVLLGSHCYYSGCGFTLDAGSREEYFSLLGSALRGERNPDAEQAARAGLCYYLAERCLSLRTCFTPQPQDYAQWVAQPRVALWSEPEQKTFLSIMAEREWSPLAIKRMIHAERSSEVITP